MSEEKNTSKVNNHSAKPYAPSPPDRSKVIMETHDESLVSKKNES